MKYRYIGPCLIPSQGAIGDAGPAAGCDDADSLESGAWIFQPDGEDSVYYVDPERDIEPITAQSAAGQVSGHQG